MLRGNSQTLIQEAEAPCMVALTRNPAPRHLRQDYKVQARSCPKLPLLPPSTHTPGGGRGLGLAPESIVEYLPGMPQTPGSILRHIHTE